MNNFISKKKPFEELTITDNFMFQAVMRDPRRVKPLLEMVLEKKIKDIKFLEVEKTKETGYTSHGIRMDVYVEDDENSVYDVEMQGFKEAFLGKRFRFYQGAIDIGIVNKGESFAKLKKSYIIFFTTFDPFGKGWYMYPFETICSWDHSIIMDDDAKRIILNIKGYRDVEGHEVSDDIKNLLAYMDGKTPVSEYTVELDDAVKKVKENEERRQEYMFVNSFEIDNRLFGRCITYVGLIRSGILEDEKLSKASQISMEFIENTKKLIKEHPDWDDVDVAEEVLIFLNS